MRMSLSTPTVKILHSITVYLRGIKLPRSHANFNGVQSERKSTCSTTPRASDGMLFTSLYAHVRERANIVHAIECERALVATMYH